MKKIIILSLVFLGGIGGVLFFVELQKKNNVPQEETPQAIEQSTTFSGPGLQQTKDPTSVELQKKIDFVLRQSPQLSDDTYSIDKYPASDEPSFVPEYTIVYSKIENRFLINLYEYPLLETREKASKALREKLTITEQEACGLNVDVTVNSSVNISLAGKSLGLSYCSGRMDLVDVKDDRISNEEK